MECLICGKKSNNCKLCASCRKEKETACAIISQNKKKMQKLLNTHCYDTDRFTKFNLYANNINKY